VQVTTYVVHDDTKTKIVDEAAEWKADLIVIGSRGRKSVLRFSLGGVSEVVASNACCSVEVVRCNSSRSKAKVRNRAVEPE
jgi:nucleotide-binding universal stress UspA family protein